MWPYQLCSHLETTLTPLHSIVTQRSMNVMQACLRAVWLMLLYVSINEALRVKFTPPVCTFRPNGSAWTCDLHPSHQSSEFSNDMDVVVPRPGLWRLNNKKPFVLGVPPYCDQEGAEPLAQHDRLLGNTATLPSGVIVKTQICCVRSERDHTHGYRHNVPSSVRTIRSTDNGKTWSAPVMVADAKSFPFSGEGPNENAIVVLSDNKTLFLSMRLGAGDSSRPNPQPSNPPSP